MSKITLDATLRSKLNGLNESLEICDEGGQTVGHFLPADVYRKIDHPVLLKEVAGNVTSSWCAPASRNASPNIHS